MNRILNEYSNRVEDLLRGLSKKEIQQVFDSILSKTSIYIPISAFNSKLSALEIIIKYLVEEENKKLSEISKLLNRKYNTISTTYKNSTKKTKKRLLKTDSSILIPIEMFQNRDFSVLEILVSYLKDNLNLEYIEIAKKLNKSQSTIRTIYRRYKLR